MPISALPVVYYSQEEGSGASAVDSVGGVNLTSNNTVGTSGGIIANSRQFDNTSSRYLSHADTSILRGGDSDWSFSCWFYLKASPSTMQLIAKDAGSTSRDYTIDLNSDTPRFYLNGGGSVLISWGSTVSPSAWHHLACGHDAANDLVWMQVDNGTRLTQATSGLVPQTTAAEFRVGARALVGSEGYFDGWIDEIGKWNMVLTTGDVTYLWNSGAGKSYAQIVADFPSTTFLLAQRTVLDYID